MKPAIPDKPDEYLHFQRLMTAWTDFVKQSVVTNWSAMEGPDADFPARLPDAHRLSDWCGSVQSAITHVWISEIAKAGSDLKELGEGSSQCVFN